MSSAVAFSWGEMVSLENLVASGGVKLGRGKVSYAEETVQLNLVN